MKLLWIERFLVNKFIGKCGNYWHCRENQFEFQLGDVCKLRHALGGGKFKSLKRGALFENKFYVHGTFVTEEEVVPSKEYFFG